MRQNSVAVIKSPCSHDEICCCDVFRPLRSSGIFQALLKTMNSSLSIYPFWRNESNERILFAHVKYQQIRPTDTKHRPYRERRSESRPQARRKSVEIRATCKLVGYRL